MGYKRSTSIIVIVISVLELFCVLVNAEYFYTISKLFVYKTLFLNTIRGDLLSAKFLFVFETTCVLSLIVTIYSVLFISYSHHGVLDFVVLINWIFYMVCLLKFVIFYKTTENK
jgi:hypothetical protein